MGQFWTKKKDQEDQDEKLAQPWAEKVGHGNMAWPWPDGFDTNLPDGFDDTSLPDGFADTIPYGFDETNPARKV